MEIYKDLSNPASQEFEKLLNSQLSKIQIEEGKIIEGKINKITEKFVFLFVEGLKSEPVLDVNELKSMGLGEKIKVGETIPVLLEKIEDKHGEVLVSASKAQKINSYSKLFDCYVDNKFEDGNLPKSVVSRISKFNTSKSNDEKLSYACIKLEVMAGIESLKKDLESRKSIQLEMLTNKFNKSSNDLNSLDDLIIHFFENLAVKEIKTADKNLWKRIIKSIEAILAN